MASRGVGGFGGLGGSYMSPGGFPAAAAPSPVAAELPRLHRESDLLKMLTDEKIRSDQHKTNYQTLKAEHARLQDEYLQLQNELKSTIEESHLMQEKYKQLVEQARQGLVAKQAEMEEARLQAVSPEKMDALRMQLAEEVEGPYREKLSQAHGEVDKYRNEYNDLRYELTFLKSEYEHSKEEHQRVQEELRAQHHAEVSNLRKERESIISKQQSETAHDTQKVRSLQRDNAQLHLKMKGLLTELEDIRAQRENLGLQSDHVARLQAKQLSEHAANIRALETEKESLKLQCDNLQKEMASTSDLHTQLTRQAHDLESENSVLRNSVEEVTHKSKLEVTNLKMEMVRERGDLQRERDRLHGQVEDLKSQLEVVQHSVEQQGNTLVEKEREMVKRVQAAREEEWQKMAKSENDKLELETKLQELERRRIDEEAQRAAERDKVEERIKTAQDAKETAERETLVLRTKLQHQESVEEQLDQEHKYNEELKARLQKVETEYHSYVSIEQELTDVNNKLKSQCELLRDELKISREKVQLGEADADKVLAQQKALWLEEKANLTRRIDELESQVGQLHTSAGVASQEHQKKKKKYYKVAMALKDKVQLLEAKTEQLELEKEALSKCVPVDVHNELKKSFRELQRRHGDFRQALLACATTQVPIGDMTFTTVTTPVDVTVPAWSFMEQERTHQRDLRFLQERLDQLDSSQRAQMEELKGFAASTPAPKRTTFLDQDIDRERESAS